MKYVEDEISNSASGADKVVSLGIYESSYWCLEGVKCQF